MEVIDTNFLFSLLHTRPPHSYVLVFRSPFNFIFVPIRVFCCWFSFCFTPNLPFESHRFRSQCTLVLLFRLRFCRYRMTIILLQAATYIFCRRAHFMIYCTDFVWKVFRFAFFYRQFYDFGGPKWAYIERSSIGLLRCFRDSITSRFIKLFLVSFDVVNHVHYVDFFRWEMIDGPLFLWDGFLTA